MNKEEYMAVFGKCKECGEGAFVNDESICLQCRLKK
jgi:uncharacterized OB-fold protein